MHGTGPLRRSSGPARIKAIVGKSRVEPDRRVQRRPQCLDCFRQGIRPILVFAAAKTMPGHHNPAAEMLVVIVARRQFMALFWCQRDLLRGFGSKE
jgi:hypothetical protein